MSLLEQQGFEVIPEVLDTDAVDCLIRATEASSIPRSRAGMRRAMEVGTVRDLASDTRLLNMAKEALGGHAIPFRATLFDKSPDSNWLVVWHQDTALPLLKRRDVPGWGPWSVKEGMLCAHAPASALEKVLAIRLHLDDSTAGNGSLRVLPKTHTLGVLSDDTVSKLAGDIEAVECVVSKGGALVMRPLLVHASSKIAQGRRRVLHIEYASQIQLPDALEISAGY